MHYYGNDGGGWWWMMIPMMVVMLVVVSVIVWAVLNAYRSHLQGIPRPPTPEEVLAHRFARGEIDTAEYDERLDALRQRAV